jgi:hypothetical protein
VASSGHDEIHQRARALAARIKESVPADLLSLRKRHLVTTTDAQFSASLGPDTFSFYFITPEGCQSFELHTVHTLAQVPGQGVELPRPDPSWLERGYTNWFGARLAFTVTGKIDDFVFGSNPYTMRSILAAAAVHAGLVKVGETKVVRVEIMLAPPEFVGSTQNGVKSNSWDMPENGAFRFID